MRYRPYNDFWQAIHKNAAKEKIPLRVMFELTYRCNFKCRHCYVPPSYIKKYRKRELNTKEVFSILDQLRGMGCFYLGFTGGELFLRPDIIDILEYSKKCGFEVIIYTNGSLIDKKMTEALSRIRPNKVDITIPAISEEAFRQVTGISGARGAVFNAVRLLRKKNINLGFKTCVVKANKQEIDYIKRFARRLCIFHRVDEYPSARLDGSKEPYKYSIKAPPLRGQAGYRTKNLFYCGAGSTQAAITPAGELKLCLMIDYPKYRILEISLNEAWQRLHRLTKSITPIPGAYYKWCPAESWLENKTFQDKISCNT